jgi:hypothetical protein
MDNYKEYLDPADGCALVKQSVNMPVHPHWIAIPEGAEIAIKFNVDRDAHGICFYKNNGKLSFSQKDPRWEESEWSKEDLLNEDFRDGNFDLTHKVLWIRKPQDQGLISGAEALRALADRKDVQVSTEFTKSSWNDDTATYSAEEILAEETAETDDYNSMKLFFRLKPQTIKIDLEIPVPFEPKHGEMYWWIDATSEEGYSYTYFDNNKADQDIMQFGAWRTEEEIKQVVEQLRKPGGNNS